MKKSVKLLAVIIAFIMLTAIVALPAMAAESDAAETTAVEAVEEKAESSEDGVRSSKAMAAAIIICVGAGIGAAAMAVAVYKSVDGMARQPEASGNIRTTMMMGLVFIETAIIYALIVAILVIFVL